MLKAELYSSRAFSPFHDESADEELSVLPRHTKVIVTGNNRTKSVLVGLHGIVKKAVGLGGWHWLVLKNGVEVKLQRNALSVLEPPTGNEVDEDDFDNCSCGSYFGEKHNDFSGGMEFSKLSKRRIQYARPWVPSASIKLTNSSSCREVLSSIHTPRLKLNLAKLGTSSLWRYWKSFNLGNINPNPTKEQMVNAVHQHFASQKLEEVQVIVEFIHTAKRLKSIDHQSC